MSTAFLNVSIALGDQLQLYVYEAQIAGVNRLVLNISNLSLMDTANSNASMASRLRP